MAIARSTQRPVESKCHSYLQDKEEGGTRVLQVGQPRFDPLEGDGAASPANHFQAYEWL